MAGRAEIRIGTSGWHYRHWVGRFYPERSSAAAMFGHYQRSFDTVELNNTFYRLPPPNTLRAWREASVPDFCFAVKASRYITHNKKLKDPVEMIERLFSRLEELGPKLGPVLFQLPPRWRVNIPRLEEFLRSLPRAHRYAFEFREPSWNTPATMELLRSYNAAYCMYHLAGYLSPLSITADWSYIRLHGPGEKYQGSYSEQALKDWVERITAWSKRLKAVYVYFDNDDSAFAATDALELKQAVEIALHTRTPRRTLPRSA